MSFDTYYGDHPWAGFTQNQRSIYTPDLLETFRMRSVYAPFVRFVTNMAAVNTGQIYYDEVFDTEPDTTAINNRALWLASRHLDSRRLSITLEHHGDKIALHKYDRLITYWRLKGGDLSALCRGKLGQNMTDYLDILVRNVMIGAPFKIYRGDATDFSGLTPASHYYNPSDGQKIWKSMANMNVPFANNPNGVQGTLMGITSPTVVYDIQNHDNDSKWVTIMEYSRPELAINYEVGMWVGCRYIQTARNTLFNAGAQSLQTTLAVNASAGDGAPSTTVDGVYTVGQASGVTNYISLTDVTGLSVGDIVTFHKTRGNTYGVTNGVLPTEGTVRNRRVISIDTENNRITLDKPLMDDFTTSHYVTLGTDVHMTGFVAGPSIAAGVGQPPMPHAPPAVDDMESIQRFTWDAYIKYQLFRVEYLAVIFSAGSDFLEYEFS